MSYLRFVWYKVQNAAGEVSTHRWAENASQIEGRLTLEQYHAENHLMKIAGPFKTRKQAVAQ